MKEVAARGTLKQENAGYDGTQKEKKAAAESSSTASRADIYKFKRNRLEFETSLFADGERNIADVVAVGERRLVLFDAAANELTNVLLPL